MISIEWFCISQVLWLAFFLAAFNWETKNKLKWYDRWKKESDAHLLTQKKLEIAEFTLRLIAKKNDQKTVEISLDKV